MVSTYQVDAMELKTATRRRHGAELKAWVLSERERPGA